MKKMICFFVACILIIGGIAACVQNENVDGGQTLPTNTNQTSTVLPQFTIPQYTIPPVPTAPNIVPSQPGVDIPDNGIYIHTGINNSIYYLGSAGIVYYSFDIISRQQLDATQIGVSLPIQHSYNVSVSQIKLKGVADIMDDGLQPNCYNTEFPYMLYLSYQGKDFKELTRLYWEKNRLYEVAKEYEAMLNNGQITREEYEAWTKPYLDALEAYKNYLSKEVEAYRSLKESDLPQFYVYTVTVTFDYTQKAIGETFTEIEVTIGDQVYQQPVGQITLRDRMELPAQLDWYIDFENADDGILGGGNGPEPYNGGVHQINTYFHFKADRYKLLKRIVLDNPAHRLDRVWLRITTADGTVFEEEWDMREPYEVYPGDDVVVYISYEDDYKQNLGYTTKVYGYLEYESDGETYCKMSECYIGNSVNLYIQYALMFEGMDLSDYYWDYYYPLFEPWRLDPEATPMR